MSATGSIPGYRWRHEPSLIVVMTLMFASLVIDGFPAGAAQLREYGARPTNFLLLVALIILGFNALLSPRRATITRRDIGIGLIVLLGIPALNLPVALLQSEVAASGPLIDWIKQYGMLVWGFISYWVWRQLLKGMTVRRMVVLLCLGSTLSLICFYADMTGSNAVEASLEVFRRKRDERVSGLATEPSIYAAWLAFIWPLVLFHARYAQSRVGRASGWCLLLAIAVSAYLCHARTIVVIAVLQIAYYGYWITRRSSGLARLRGMLMLTLLAVIFALVFAQSFASLSDTDMGSNISRIGSTITALRVSMAHPWVGVGIGQLKYFFAQYAPDFALASEEILTYATGVAEFRASSFNLFARFLCEFGVGIGLIFTCWVMRPLIWALRAGMYDRFIPYAILAAIGGTGFWLTQDQYGYQPAILSLAILANIRADHEVRNMTQQAGV